MLELLTLARGAAAAREEDTPEIPLPPVVDTPTVVLLAMLVAGPRPVALDASAVREVEEGAAALLESLLCSLDEAGTPARVEGASASLRRRWRGHPLGDRMIPAAAWSGDEAMFICPDRDELGFAPSFR